MKDKEFTEELKKYGIMSKENSPLRQAVDYLLSDAKFALKSVSASDKIGAALFALLLVFMMLTNK